MRDINAKVAQNFHENIEYLQQHHPKVFEKLSAFEIAVENGHYKEKYELVFENENFDVLEHKTKKFLYDNQTTYHTQKSLDKYIFFGVGLGLHIEAIAEHIQAKMYLIVEDDLEFAHICENFLKDSFEKGTNETLSYYNDLIQIKGNQREKIFTTPHFFTSVNLINNYFANIVKPSQQFYNLSYGAYFQKTQASTFKELKDLPNLPDSIEYELARVLDSYLYYILNFIYDYLNDPKIPQEDFQHIDQLFKKHLVELISVYRNYLHKALKGNNQ